MAFVNNVVVVKGVGNLADATYTLTRPAMVYDFLVINVDGSGGGVQLTNGGSSISGLVDPPDAVGGVSRVITGDDWFTAEKTFAVGDTILMSDPPTPGGQANYQAYVYIYPLPGYGS